MIEFNLTEKKECQGTGKQLWDIKKQLKKRFRIQYEKKVY